jgi:hypothetical protein
VFCSERERLRGDQEIWEALDEHTIGVKEGASGMQVKFAFDTVFGGKATNKQVLSVLSTPAFRGLKTSIPRPQNHKQ